MTLGLGGRRAVVTGASRRIGLAVACASVTLDLSSPVDPAERIDGDMVTTW
ncbi:hypothetical protein [Nocardioides sp. CER19]|uniref:hypothetical protein n=1 Tax=Nocardioides sp. CER19 TaxID=3038538 RepID=UPI0024497E73|nr:hypothetical protein [Nocardioides sp. CER19]MDH2415963.1 hypothetical protein [Nocardioides sp. CER19]